MVVRKSPKFNPTALLMTLMSSVVTGKGSFNQLVTSLKDRVERPMARQSLHERIGIASTAFLMTVLCSLMRQRFQSAGLPLKGGVIRRVVIEHASSQAMPKGNAEIPEGLARVTSPAPETTVAEMRESNPGLAPLPRHSLSHFREPSIKPNQVTARQKNASLDYSLTV